mgnify:CR=1 FL=1
MSMRLSGLMSGMDTESIIQELVMARRTKVEDATRAQTKHEWKQEAWKDLNTKLKNLQAKYLGNMRLESNYSKKTTKISDDSVASIITGDAAMEGVQQLEVLEMAKTSYMTGGQMSFNGSSKLTALTNLRFLNDGDKALEVPEGSKLTINAGDKTVEMDITVETSISDIIGKLKEAGLNANFDEKQQRLFISAKESGKDNNFTITATDDSILNALGLGNTAKKIEGQDAKIVLNETVFESNTNVFEINGLTITALSETEDDKPVTVTTQRDVDGIYDMVKNFLKEYNSIINEMDKLYNADSAKDFEPLTDEEKDAMSEEEVEKYEKKIKEALLRRDSNLYSISSAMKDIMMSGFEVNGKKMYLSNFGIDTLPYMDAPDNERNAYHIAGDEDDEDFAEKSDVLKGMISSDPDTVISFFSQLSASLYSKLNDMSKSVEGYRSFGSFYDDKKMKEDYDGYTSKIKTLEEKLADYEDKWYKKFADMETAMAKMQSNASAVTSLLGG